MKRLASLALLFTPHLALAQDADGGGGGSGASGGGFDLDQVVGSLNEHVAPWGIKIVGALVGLFAAWVVAGTLGRAIRRAGERRSIDVTLVRFVANMVRYVVLTAAVVAILGVFGIETSSFAAIIGAAGLAIGLAFEGTLGNFAAGVMLLVFRPFKVGDFVDAGGILGTIEEVELFTTTMKTPDNKKIIVPNKQIGGATITNYAAYPERRVDVEVGVDYAVRVDVARAALEEAVARCDQRLHEPEAQIFLKGLGASSVDWVCRVWCKSEDYWVLHEQLVRAIHDTLSEKGIGIPFPQMDVHLDEGVVEALRAGRT